MYNIIKILYQKTLNHIFRFEFPTRPQSQQEGNFIEKQTPKCFLTDTQS